MGSSGSSAEVVEDEVVVVAGAESGAAVVTAGGMIVESWHDARERTSIAQSIITLIVFFITVTFRRIMTINIIIISYP